MFGVEISEADDFTMSPVAAKVAASQAVSLVHSLAQTTDAGAPDAASAIEWLEGRMRLWAATLAMEEAFEAAQLDPGIFARGLDGLLRRIRRGIGRVDGNMQRHMTSLRPAAGTYLLTNWRRLLAPCHREVLPWWLDGCIG